MRDLNEIQQQKYEDLLWMINQQCEDVFERETLIELVDELVETLMED